MSEERRGCECCGKDNLIVGVAAIPGVPMSIAWCADCIRSGAVPMWVCEYLAGEVADGHPEALADWAHETIDLTLAYFERDRAEFWESARDHFGHEPLPEGDEP